METQLEHILAATLSAALNDALSSRPVDIFKHMVRTRLRALLRPRAPLGSAGVRVCAGVVHPRQG